MINSKLEEIRKKKKISKTAMAKKLGVSVAKLNSWESGKSELPIDMLLPIAGIFNMSVDELLKSEINMREEEKNSLRKSLILTIHTLGMDEAASLAKQALLDYPHDNSLKLMIATVLFLGDSDNMSAKWLHTAIELLDSIQDWDEDFMRSVIYTKAMILNFLNQNERCEKELDKIDWNILDPLPLYAKAYREQGKIEQQKRLACKRLYHHLNSACLMLEELSFSFDEPQKSELLLLQARLSQMFGLSYLKAFLELCNHQLKAGKNEEAKASMIEYLSSLAKLKKTSIKQSITDLVQGGIADYERQNRVEKALNELLEDQRFICLLEDEKVKEQLCSLKKG